MDFSFFSFFCPCLGLGEIETLEGIKKQGLPLVNPGRDFSFLCLGICKAPAVVGAFLFGVWLFDSTFLLPFLVLTIELGAGLCRFRQGHGVRSFPPWVMCPAVVFFRTVHVCRQHFYIYACRGCVRCHTMHAVFYRHGYTYLYLCPHSRALPFSGAHPVDLLPRSFIAVPDGIPSDILLPKTVSMPLVRRRRCSLSLGCCPADS